MPPNVFADAMSYWPTIPATSTWWQSRRISCRKASLKSCSRTQSLEPCSKSSILTQLKFQMRSLLRLSAHGTLSTLSWASFCRRYISRLEFDMISEFILSGTDQKIQWWEDLLESFWGNYCLLHIVMYWLWVQKLTGFDQKCCKLQILRSHTEWGLFNWIIQIARNHSRFLLLTFL